MPATPGEPRAGPLGLGVAFNLFCLETNLKIVGVGWGRFQNILRCVPERRRGESPAVVVPGMAPGARPHSHSYPFCPQTPCCVPPSPPWEVSTQHEAFCASFPLGSLPKGPLCQVSTREGMCRSLRAHPPCQSRWCCWRRACPGNLGSSQVGISMSLGLGGGDRSMRAWAPEVFFPEGEVCQAPHSQSLAGAPPPPQHLGPQGPRTRGRGRWCAPQGARDPSCASAGSLGGRGPSPVV